MKDNWDYEHGITIFERDDRFSEPFWHFHNQLGSIQKYWLMTRDLVSEQVLGEKEFFVIDEEQGSEPYDSDLEIRAFPSNRDGDAVEHDFGFIPDLTRIIILCMILSSIETFLKNLCSELHDDPDLNDKGSYIQRYIHFITRHSGIEFSKDHLKYFDAMSQIRNSYLHQLDLQSVSPGAMEFLDSKTAPFAKLSAGVSSAHVDLFFQVTNAFGAHTQSQYWDEYQGALKP